MKNYQVITVEGLTATIQESDGKLNREKILALVFHEGKDGELRVKGVTKSDLYEGSIDFDDANYDFLQGRNVILISDK